MQDIPHAQRGRVGQHDQAQAARGLVEVQLVLGGAVRDEGVVVAAQLAHHVAQGEDGSEDELGIVGGGGAGGCCCCRGVGRGGGARGQPGFGVDAFRWRWGGGLADCFLLGWMVSEGRDGRGRTGSSTVPVKDVERVDDHGGGGRGGPPGQRRVAPERVEVEGREDGERRDATETPTTAATTTTLRYHARARSIGMEWTADVGFLQIGTRSRRGMVAAGAD